MKIRTSLASTCYLLLCFLFSGCLIVPPNKSGGIKDPPNSSTTQSSKSQRSIVAAWKLISTTDPQFSSSLDENNYLVWEFDDNAAGTVKKVVDGQLHNDPIFYLKYTESSDQKLVRTHFLIQAQDTADAGIFDYDVEIDRSTLTLTQVDTGLTYEFDYAGPSGSGPQITPPVAIGTGGSTVSFAFLYSMGFAPEKCGQLGEESLDTRPSDSYEDSYYMARIKWASRCDPSAFDQAILKALPNVVDNQGSSLPLFPLYGVLQNNGAGSLPSPSFPYGPAPWHNVNEPKADEASCDDIAKGYTLLALCVM